MPCGKADTSICWVSAVRLPVWTVWPMRLVILNDEFGMLKCEAFDVVNAEC